MLQHYSCLWTQFCIWVTYSALVTQQLEPLEQNLFHSKHSQSNFFFPKLKIFSILLALLQQSHKLQQSLSVRKEFHSPSITVFTRYSYNHLLTFNLSSLGFQIHTQILDIRASHNTYINTYPKHPDIHPPQTEKMLCPHKHTTTKSHNSTRTWRRTLENTTQIENIMKEIFCRIK